MAITTIQQAISGRRNNPAATAAKLTVTSTAARWQSLWAATGDGRTGTYNTSLNGANCDVTTDGAMRYSNAAADDLYLAAFENSGTATSIAGAFMLCDRLWHNGGYTITSTAAQNTTMGALPARDDNASTNGVNVMMGLDIQTVTGAATSTAQVSYTNSAGTAGRLADLQAVIPSAASARSVFLYNLQGTDDGVRSVQSLTLGTSLISGTIGLFLFRPLIMTRLSSRVVSRRTIDDIMSAGLQKVHPSSCIFGMYVTNAGLASTTIAYTPILTNG